MLCLRFSRSLVAILYFTGCESPWSRSDPNSDCYTISEEKMTWAQAKQVRWESISIDLTGIMFWIATEIIYTYSYFSTVLISGECSQSHGHENKQVTSRAICPYGIWFIG